MSRTQSPIRTALVGLIGNVLEWFDFAVYGYFATDIGKLYFPSEDEDAAAVAAFAVFAIGFIARPAGSLVLGRIGDRIGRRALLTLSIALMGGATLGIGILPSYATIGIAAPILLLVLRMAQGFSLGGEFTGSMVYTTELASPLWRGLISSSTAAGTTLGFILGSAAAWLISANLPAADAATWGWRIPFIASVVFVIAGYFLRRGIEESEHAKLAAAARAPILPSLLADWRPIVQTVGIVGLTNAAYYLVFTFSPDLRKTTSPGDGSNFLLVNTLSLFVVLFAKPVGGWLSDRVGRRRMMIALSVLMMAVVYVALQRMLHGTPTEFFVGQLLLAVPLGMALGLQGAMVVEIFPLRTRVTSMSFGYSAALALSGGIAPLVSKWLNKTYEWDMLPAIFVMSYGVFGLPILFAMRETNSRSLDQ